MEHNEKLADFTTDLSVLRLSLMAVVIGMFSAVAAALLVKLIGLITNIAFYQRFSFTFLSPAQNHLGLLVVIVPVIGGLIIGVLAKYGSEKIRGHGIPEAIEAILIGRSKMDLKVTILKPISSAISIGTGGPFGAEGPIIMTGGALASLFAQGFNMSSAERKTLLVAGAAGGMAAIFSAPVAAILLAVELLLFEWRPRSFIPVAISSMVAATLRVPLLGGGPIFPVAAHGSLGSEIILFACVVGVIAGAGSTIVTSLVYWCEELFEKLPIHWMWWPAIGCLAVGIGGIFEPHALGAGYDTIQSLLNGNMLGPVVLGLLIGKALMWAIALGSGTSGGVLAPLLIMGGALGVIEAQWIPVGDAGLWAMVSMAALMGGTMRIPLTAIVFAVEVTHDFNVLPALVVATVISETITVLTMKRSILTEKISRRGLHLSYEYSVSPADVMRVSDIMDTDVPTIPSDMTLQKFKTALAADTALANRHGFPVIDKNGKLMGIIARCDINNLTKKQRDRNDTIGKISKKDLVVAYPYETIQQIIMKMVKHKIGRILVVDPTDEKRLIGYIGRSGILSAWSRMAEDENIKEKSWSLPAISRPHLS